MAVSEGGHGAPLRPGKISEQMAEAQAESPSWTLTAHLGKDSYSHIHYDSEQARTISVREAARLRAFRMGSCSVAR